MKHCKQSIKPILGEVGNEIIYNTEVGKSNLCDYNYAYILLRGNITIVRDNGVEVFMEHSKIVDHSLSISQKLMEQQ